VPAALAASAARVPVLVHEQNAVFGRANRLVARFARVVALTFADTAAVPPLPSARRLVSGNPVRPDFAAGDVPYAPPEPDGPFRLLVMGGSQGARVFSDAVPAAAALLPPELRARLEIAQQCRPEDLERARAAYDALGMRPELAPFFADAPARMARAHLVVTRSGASTVAELLLLARPCVLVPYPHAADDHQAANARHLAEAGAARLVPQAELDAGRLAGLLAELMLAPSLLGEMAQRARGLARPDAAGVLADAVLALANGDRER
jgi:UDP-N-acetylglucosamine--N-acetylmuramyl-(pentapeptide) pyrophosphoryl-undecaprenol N-acetylglucosamine transferase